MACLGDMGYKSGEGIRAGAVIAVAQMQQVAAAAIAIDNANQLVDNYKKQRDISQRGQNIARSVQDQLQNVFWPREEQFLAEFANPEALETVEAMGRRYAGRLVADIAGAFAKQLREARCSFRRYCSSANRKLVQDLMLARANTMASARVLGRNIAFAEFQARDDVNLSRRMQAVAIGRGMIQEAMTLYRAAGASMAAAGDTLSNNFNSAIESFGMARELGARAAMSRDFHESQAMERSEYARMPGTTGSDFIQLPGNPMPTNPTGFGIQSSQQSMFSPTAGSSLPGDTSELSKNNKPSDFLPGMGEQSNHADVGNRDLARTGIYTFPVIGITGGSVVIDMDKFPLRYVDHLNEREPYGFSI